MRITVFTPTYNRAYCLPRLYESLKAQTFFDFEWLVVDDGSTDGTEALIQSMIADKPFFPIKYLQTENGGKHRAINRGIGMASGELTLLMDSDDWLRKDALEWIDRVEHSISDDQKQSFAGVQGLRVHTDGSLVGKTYSGDGYLDTTTLERNKHGIVGDKAEVYYTDVLRRYPFPEINGEKFLTERIVWDKIAHDGYLIRYFNEGIYYCEYLEDGLTSGGNCLYARNPVQWAMAIYQDYKFGGKNFYNTSIQIFIFYLYEKGRLRSGDMIRLLGFSKVSFWYSVLSQQFVDIGRYILHGKKTIQKTAREDIAANRTNA